MGVWSRESSWINEIIPRFPTKVRVYTTEMSRKRMISNSLWTEKPKRMNSITLVLFLPAIYSSLLAAEKKQDRARDKLFSQGIVTRCQLLCVLASEIIVFWGGISEQTNTSHFKLLLLAVYNFLGQKLRDNKKEINWWLYSKNNRETKKSLYVCKDI